MPAGRRRIAGPLSARVPRRAPRRHRRGDGRRGPHAGGCGGPARRDRRRARRRHHRLLQGPRERGGRRGPEGRRRGRQGLLPRRDLARRPAGAHRRLDRRLPRPRQRLAEPVPGLALSAHPGRLRPEPGRGRRRQPPPVLRRGGRRDAAPGAERGRDPEPPLLRERQQRARAARGITVGRDPAGRQLRVGLPAGRGERGRRRGAHGPGVLRQRAARRARQHRADLRRLPVREQRRPDRARRAPGRRGTRSGSTRSAPTAATSARSCPRAASRPTRSGTARWARRRRPAPRPDRAEPREHRDPVRAAGAEEPPRRRREEPAAPPAGGRRPRVAAEGRRGLRPLGPAAARRARRARPRGRCLTGAGRAGGPRRLAGAGRSPAPAASPAPDATPAPAPDPVAPDVDLVVSEQLGSVVEPARATKTSKGLAVDLVFPQAPGLYRLVAMLHTPEGVAYDAATQALLTPVLVRIRPAIAAAYGVQPSLDTTAGAAAVLPVRVLNAGSKRWDLEVTAPPHPPGRRAARDAAHDDPAREPRRDLDLGDRRGRSRRRWCSGWTTS